MITRRKFLQIAGWCAAPVAVGVLARRHSVEWAIDRAIVRITALVQGPEERLRSHFGYLTLDAAGIKQYFADYERSYGPLPRHQPLSSDFCTRYLMSTDFFRHDADESRLVRYVGFYDPDRTACNNPLARFDEAE
jgi:hypothetical protein